MQADKQGGDAASYEPVSSILSRETLVIVSYKRLSSVVGKVREISRSAFFCFAKLQAELISLILTCILHTDCVTCLLAMSCLCALWYM